MSDQFLGEIRMFGMNFAPTGWAFCAGQILPLSQYSALFSILGTNFGGNGTTNFALPNLQGNIPLHAGASAGPGLSAYVIGEQTGTPTVTVQLSQLATHSHQVLADATPGNLKTPTAGCNLSRATAGSPYHPPDASVGPMAVGMVGPAGGNAAHNNLMPFLAINFCIALQGIFPPRS